MLDSFNLIKDPVNEFQSILVKVEVFFGNQFFFFFKGVTQHSYKIFKKYIYKKKVDLLFE